MKKIALLACSKSKKGKDQPEELFCAEDIYTGNSFRKSLDKVKKKTLMIISLFPLNTIYLKKTK